MGRQRSARPDKCWSGPGRFSPGPHREPLGDDCHAWTPLNLAAPLGVADVRFDPFHQLGRHVPNAMFHIPSDLVVDQWVSNVESRSPRDFLFLHDLWTTFRHLLWSQITPAISMAWNFTTKSGGI
jgi:hypothetical protein